MASELLHSRPWRDLALLGRRHGHAGAHSALLNEAQVGGRHPSAGRECVSVYWCVVGESCVARWCNMSCFSTVFWCVHMRFLVLRLFLPTITSYPAALRL